MQPESPIPLTSESRRSKLPRSVLSEFDCEASIFAFPPNRATLGGTAYLIVESAGNVLIDCPAWDEPMRSFLTAQGGVRWLVITHRGGLGKVRELQQAFDCEVIIQEQEAYLLPGLTVSAFQTERSITGQIRVIWTAGHSPGTACVYYAACGGILFSGRHLVPDRHGNPTPLRTAKTFHWPRQLRNVQTLIETFNSDTLRFICPGASSGLLRGKTAIDHAYFKLSQLDLAACSKVQPF